MAVCNFCGAQFGSRQAVRGHLRGCAAYQAQKAGDAPEPSGNEPTGTTMPRRQEIVPKAPTMRSREPQFVSRLDHDSLEVLLQVFEELQALRHGLIKELKFVRRPMSSLVPDNGTPAYQDWEALAKDVVGLERAANDIVTQARVSRGEFWDLHKLSLTVRDRWLTWRRQEAHIIWEQEDHGTGTSLTDVLDACGIPELEQRLTRIVDGLRWLTSRTRATQ